MSPTSNWNDSDPSDDEQNTDSLSTRKRSSRACDQCRKTKSKCEPSPSSPGACKSCALAGNACTFLGPSYKRGPPKGYIQAIEQRWHQVESLLGAVIACPDRRVQDIISDLRQDELAREILNRVDSGPFGPSGRLHSPSSATKEDFFASIFRSNEASARDLARSRRQSRVSREIVSSSRDHLPSTMPTPAWQDRLAASVASSHRAGSSSSSTATHSQNSFTYGTHGVPLPQRRRLNTSPDWSGMYTMDALSESDKSDETNDPTDAFGQLSLDENSEVRYHGKASGLHLLGLSDRIDSRHEGGIWRFPMARIWPPAKSYIAHLSQEEVDVPMPPSDVQDHLINLYFTYVHPVFPVIHKQQFLAEYDLRKRIPCATPESDSSSSHSPRTAEPSQIVTKLLLLSMFAIAVRYSDDAPPPPAGKMWEAGCEYMVAARDVITKVFHSSRVPTCQALLLLGHREFGIGSMEQGWLYIGMAIRMAIDLGLNRAADKWQSNGAFLFSPEERQVRYQIWWACCLADKYGSVYMGRPVCIAESDFDTPLPHVTEDDDEVWQGNIDHSTQSHPATPARVMSCFRASASLSIIVGAIVTMSYPVRPYGRASRLAVLAHLDSRLDQWRLNLPEHLRYDPASKRMIQPPPILFLHLQYWSAVLLLHRAHLPNWKGHEQILNKPSSEADTSSLKAFDLCQSAATYVSAIITTYLENFNLARSSPFLTSYILSAGIMHIVTLTLRPSNVQAYIGLQQCLTALKATEIIWPSASRAWDLLHGVKVRVDSNLTPMVPGSGRPKRPADAAFGQEKSSDFLQREAFGELEKEQSPQNENGIQDMSTRIMAHMLGLDIPGIEASTSYYPGYEWWPRQENMPPTYVQPTVPVAPDPLMTYGQQNEWPVDPGMAGYSYDFSGAPSYSM